MDRKEAEKRARAAQRIAALGEMTGGIAHDFRNILATIESALRLAERNVDDPAAVRRFIAGAREGTGRGQRLIAQLLAFAGQQELNPRPTDVNAHLRGMEPFLNYAAGPAINVVLQLAPDLSACHIDPPQFSAAILNLVVNARDAMPGGGEIHIRTAAASDEHVRVSVEDSGQGIPADVLEKIFDPLFTTKGDKGTGLGLPHVAAVMRLIGGHVEVHSEAGKGTTFELLFRVAGSG